MQPKIIFRLLNSNIQQDYLLEKTLITSHVSCNIRIVAVYSPKQPEQQKTETPLLFVTDEGVSVYAERKIKFSRRNSC